jgi:hypothetical protein
MRLTRQARRASAHRPGLDIRERAGRPISTAQITRFGVTPCDRPAGQAARTAARRSPVAPGTATRASRSRRPFHLCQPVHTGAHPTALKGQASGSHSGSQRWQIPSDTGRRAQTIRPARCIAERCQTTYRDAWQVPSMQRIVEFGSDLGLPAGLDWFSPLIEIDLLHRTYVPSLKLIVLNLLAGS